MRRPASARRSVVAAILVMLGAWLSFTSVASAGTYDVLTCQTPSGQPTSTAGWRAWSQLLYDTPTQACRRGGRGLTAKFSAREGGVAGGLASGWTFRAPSGTTIAGVHVAGMVVARPATDRGGAFARAGIGDLPMVAGTEPDGPVATTPGDATPTTPPTTPGTTPTTPTAETGDSEEPTTPAETPAPAANARPARCDATGGACRLAKRGAAVALTSDHEFSVYAGCVGSSFHGICSRGPGSRAVASLRSARITLSDTAEPRATVSGEAVTANAIRGTSSLHLSATDVGAGVWQAQIQIGNKVVLPRTTLDARGGRCAQIPGTTAFANPVPCPSRASRTLNFNTKRGPDGSQMLTVTVWDAANNPKIVAFRPVLVDNAHRVRSDGTIMMPAPGTGGSLGGGNLLVSGGQYAPPATSDPALEPLLSAMNTLAGMQLPYCYGGGHDSTPAVPSAGSYCWVGNPAKKVTNSGTVGFDCSSSVSWVLQQTGIAIETATSGEFMQYGEPGPGRAVTIWANGGHVFLEIEIDGHVYYWGTASANFQHGPGWTAPHTTSGFVARHPPGL